MRLKGYKKVEGTIEVITGLHIGGSTTIIEIGGKDNPVIKHPVTKEPYIPGSSIKGRMRSLLELKLGKINADSKSNNFGQVHGCKGNLCPICVIFGTSADEAALGPTRLIVRDAILDKDFKEEQRLIDNEWTALDLTEDKYENTINRITARATPRNFERVVSGTKFAFQMSYKVFERNEDKGTDDESLFSHVLDGLRLVEQDALGGAGSRGCGQVQFWIDVGNGDMKSLNEVTVDNFPTQDF